MPDFEPRHIEQQLRNVLSAQADTVETDLSGPELRVLAEDRVRTRRRTAGQALVAAVVVAVIGLAPQVFTGPERTHRPAPSPIAPGATVSPRPALPTPSHPHQRISRAPHGSAVPTPAPPRTGPTPAASATPRSLQLPSRSNVTRRAPQVVGTQVAGTQPPVPSRTLRPNATTSP